MDSSALVKAIVSEEGSELVLHLLTVAGPASASRIAYVECHAAFARGRREGRLTDRQTTAAARNLDERWTDLVIVEIDGTLAKRARDMVYAHTLRAADAIHLASAVDIAAGKPSQTTLACWDGRLWEAASALGFRMMPPSRPRS